MPNGRFNHGVDDPWCRWSTWIPFHVLLSPWAGDRYYGHRGRGSGSEKRPGGKSEPYNINWVMLLL